MRVSRVSNVEILDLRPYKTFAWCTCEQHAMLRAGLMITSLVSYLSHSQVWALQNDGKLYVGGRTNRATVMFEQELRNVLVAIPLQSTAHVAEVTFEEVRERP